MAWNKNGHRSSFIRRVPFRRAVHELCSSVLAMAGLLFFLPFANSQTSSVHFERIPQAQELPSQYISEIYQDSKGFLWFGSNNGVARYDGYAVKSFRRSYDNNQSLLDNVWNIYEDKNGILWLGGSQGLAQYDRRTNQFHLFPAKNAGAKSTSSSYIGSINEDDAGRLWVSCTQDSFHLYDPKTATFQRYLFDTKDFPWLSFSVLYKDTRKRNTFWVGGPKGSLIQFDTEAKKFEIFTAGKPLGWLFNDVRHFKDGTLWLAGQQGVWYFDAKSRQIRPIEELWPQLGKLSAYNTLRLLEDRTGVVWIGTVSGGLFEFDRSTGKLIHHQHDPSDPKSISSNDISKLYQDRSGIVWVGTRNGLNLVVRDNSPFKHFKLRLRPTLPLSRVTRINVNALYEDREGTLWAGSEYFGVYRVNQTTENSQYITIPPQVHENFAYCFYETRNGDIWMGMNGQGLVHYNKKENNFRRVLPDSTIIGLGNYYVKAIGEDRSGKLWMATFGGLTRLDPLTGVFRFYGTNDEKPASDTYPANAITSLFITRKGLIWMTADAGIYVFDPATEVFQRLPLPANRDEAFIYEDSKGVLWSGGTSGLMRIETSGDTPGNIKIKATTYTDKNGIRGVNVYGVLEDGQGQIWFSTQEGLTVFKNPHHTADASPVFKNYNTWNDLQCPPFIGSSLHKNRRGEFFFGTVTGILHFHPDSIQNDAYASPLVITRFSFFDASQPDNSLLEEQGISGMDEITLSYRNNIFSIEFAAIDFRDPSKIRYAYQMTGFNDNWIDLNNRRQVTFTNLDPGTYIFKVKSTNSDGVWIENPAVLKVTILPPWWRTWWAYASYFIVFAAALYVWVKLRTRSLEVRARQLEAAVAKSTAQVVEQKEQLEVQAGQLQELDRMKSNFYTNITHEFRTPLTVILGMADQAEDYFRNTASRQFDKAIQLIRRNGKSLLKLINELLDLSKLDSGAMRLYMVRGDVTRFISYLLESFQSLAESKNIRLSFESAQPVIDMDFDQDKMQRILANLVSNAIKFTPDGGTVGVLLSTETTPSGEEMLLIRVKDSGIGIAEDQLPYVFDRFYQASVSPSTQEEVTPFKKGVTSVNAPSYGGGRAEAGTGIGLALSRELVHLLSGTISATSVKGSGSEFVVKLPIRRMAQEGMSIPQAAAFEDWMAPAAETVADPRDEKSGSPDRPQLLIVEDNPDVAYYLQACVAAHYEATLASNGQRGIDLALERIPDLIISDVMMPEKDGFELCETLKNDARTSHIPIVLLTAKADMASRIEGLTRGADVYLAKPFDKQELLVQMHRLLHSRQQLQARYAAMTPAPSDDPDVVIEDRFLANIRTIVDTHMHDETFGIEELAVAAFLSSSQLFRKIKALTGKSPALYLRSLRLQQAMSLLKTTESSISEVAYQVGFSDPAYFSRTFAQEFGVAPSAVRKGQE